MICFTQCLLVKDFTSCEFHIQFIFPWEALKDAPFWTVKNLRLWDLCNVVCINYNIVNHFQKGNISSSYLYFWSILEEVFNLSSLKYIIRNTCFIIMDTSFGRGSAWSIVFLQTFPKPPIGPLKLRNCVFILKLSSELHISELCLKEWTKQRRKQYIFKVFAYVYYAKKSFQQSSRISYKLAMLTEY